MLFYFGIENTGGAKIDVSYRLYVQNAKTVRQRTTS